MANSHSLICKGCWQHMRLPIPIRGPFSLPLRLLGVKISRMNPNLCTICETMFTRVKRKKQVIIPATVLFCRPPRLHHDIEAAASSDVVGMLHLFYDECASDMGKDGIVNKLSATPRWHIQLPDHARGSCPQAAGRARHSAEMFTKKEVGVEVGASMGVGIESIPTSINRRGRHGLQRLHHYRLCGQCMRIQGTAKAGEVLE
jgi:hypothetical protein